MRNFAFLLISFFIPLICNAQVKDVRKGDILQVNGAKGIVFNVNEDGTHGQILEEMQNFA